MLNPDYIETFDLDRLAFTIKSFLTIFGIYSHKINTAKLRLMQGFTDNFPMPVSRHTEIKIEDINNYPEFDILSQSNQAGIGMIINNKNDDFFIFVIY